MTVGASVDPYVRLTVQPSFALASSTNAAVTPAPPEDTSRNDATAALENVAAPISPMKNVGGPIMNVMRSRSMIRNASSGSHRAIITDFIGHDAGEQHAVQQSRDVRERRGHEDGVVRP